VPNRSKRLAAVALASLLATTACGGDGGGASRVATIAREIAGLLGVTGGATPLAESAPAPADPDASVALAAPIEAEAEVGEPVAETGGYWRYVEPNGSLRFVQSLAEVPASARATAEHVAASGPRPAPAPRARPTRTARAWSAEPSEPVRGDEPAVVVYTTSWCGWCRKTLAWLDERGVAYENRDIERDADWAAELQRKTGATSIPVVDVGGSIVRGFDPDRLAELL
jgi:glutaredoxin